MRISGLILRSSKLPSRKAWPGCTRASRPRFYDSLLVAESCCWVSDSFSVKILEIDDEWTVVEALSTVFRNHLGPPYV